MANEDLLAFKNNLITPLVPVTSRHRLEFLWYFNLKISPEQLWPLLSDTSRMNRDLGLSRWKEQTIEGVLHAEAVTLGRLQRWIEKPWIWVEPKEIQNHRIFSTGWMTEQRGVFTVHPLPDGGSRVGVYFQWGFRSAANKFLFKLASNILKKKFAYYFKDTELSAAQVGRRTTAKKQKEISEEIKLRIQKISQELGGAETTNSVTRDLAAYFLTADEMDLDKVRIKEIAKKIKTPHEDALRSVHSFMEKGYLYLAWDVVCPHCRAAVASETKLSEISDKNICQACDIEFSIEKEESVEVVFHLTDKLRSVSAQEYCAAEPAKKKHIKLCQSLAPQQLREFSLVLRPGHYHLRSSGGTYRTFEVAAEGGLDKVHFSLSKPRENIPGTVSPELRLELQNDSMQAAMVTLEEAWWLNDRLMPGEILSYPDFRKFFSNDYLGSGVKLYLGNQVLLFTDIVGSTPLYRELGDARAFEVVRRHYNEISEEITASRGVLIKFIGDAVMAAFLDLEDAVAAAISIQRKFSDRLSANPVRLRISMNYGPVLCANLNVGLDYFGTTVNTAAKIQKWGRSHQIVTTQGIWDAVKGRFGQSVSALDVQRDEALGLDIVILTVL